MSASPFPFPREEPGFVKQKPERDPRHDGVCDVQPRIPFAECVKAEAIPGIHVRQALMAWMDLKLRIENMHIGALGQSISNFDRIDVAEFSGLQFAPPHSSLPGTGLGLKLWVGGKKPMALQRRAHDRPRKVSIARHGTCLPECVRLRSLR